MKYIRGVIIIFYGFNQFYVYHNIVNNFMKARK